MSNANALIRNHEAEKERQRQSQLENQRTRQANIEELNRQKKLKIDIYEKKMDSLIDNADNLFR